MSSNPDELEKAKIYLDLALKTDSIIQQANQRLNEKVKDALTLASALIPVVAALGYFIAKETSAYWILLPIFISLLTFLVAIVQGIWLNRPTNYKYVDPSVIAEKYREKPLRFIINKSAATWCNTTSHNVSIINGKENGLKVMYALVVSGLGILAVSFLLFALFMII